jgi:hypothetical protein
LKGRPADNVTGLASWIKEIVLVFQSTCLLPDSSQGNPSMMSYVRSVTVKCRSSVYSEPTENGTAWTVRETNCCEPLARVTGSEHKDSTSMPNRAAKDDDMARSEQPQSTKTLHARPRVVPRKKIKRLDLWPGALGPGPPVLRFPGMCEARSPPVEGPGPSTGA